MGDELSYAIGFAIGFLGGLMPGLHSNTLISVLWGLGLDERALAIMIIALFPAHIISSFVPSVFFGVPDSSTVLSVLPGQRMVLRGEGLVALRAILLSCVVAALLSCAIFPVSLDLFPAAYGIMRGQMGWILLAISLVLLSRSRSPLLSAAIFALSGILGQISLNSGMHDPFLPLFSGMFAMAAIINYKKSSVPQQRDAGVGPDFLKFAVAGVLLGMIADLIPGVGSPSQVATFATIAMPLNTVGYLSMISSISVSQAIFSLSTSASIGKSRVGATAWLSESMDIGENLALLLALFIISMAVSALLVHIIRGRIAKIASLDFSKANLVLALYIAAVTIVLDGFPGLIVLALSSALGLLALKIGVERTNLMGAMIVPTLMLLFRIFI